jgi:hypothetical protein
MSTLGTVCFVTRTPEVFRNEALQVGCDRQAVWREHVESGSKERSYRSLYCLPEAVDLEPT